MWGLVASAVFFIPLYKGIWKAELLQRYCANNWLECVEVTLFFVGLASLLLKLFELSTQSAGLNKSLLPPPETAASGASPSSARSPAAPLAQASTLLAWLESLPAAEQRRNLPRRLRDVLRAILLKGSTDGLGEELKYLSEADAMQAQSSQSAVRVIIWAIPILGILGTVLGIARVTAQVDAQVLDDSLPTVMEGLGIAFDTTALGLGLSMALVFLQSFVERFQHRLMAAIDRRAIEELAGRFETARSAALAASGDGWLRLEPVLRELLRVTKAQHEELLKLGPRLAEVAATSRAGFDVGSAPEVAIRAIAEQPEEAVAALVQAIYQFNLDVARLEQELPAPLSFAGACDLLPVRLGPPETAKRARRKRLTDRRSAA
jgi:biopolymer transport protein ExbB/TolQ